MAKNLEESVFSLKSLTIQAFIITGLLLIGCQPNPKNGDDLGPDAKANQDVEEKVIYGDDDRLNYYQVPNSQIQSLADSTVALFQSAELKVSGSTVSLPTETLQEGMGACSSEPFAKEPMGAFCSGSLVGEDLVMTAGHCITNASACSSAKFVFGYHVKLAGAYPSSVPSSEVYGCQAIVKREEVSTGADYGLIRLDRKVTNHSILKIRRSGNLSAQDPVFVIGYPSGLPSKVASGGVVRSVTSTHYVTNLDTYGGNSGSAVFNARTFEVEGILVRGETDYINQGSCRVSNRCPATGCRGEDVTRVDLVRDQIPEVGGNPNPPPPPSTTIPNLAYEVSSKLAVNIPDKNTVGISSVLNAQHQPNGRAVQVGVEIIHPYIGDLVVSLVAPNGKTYVLQKNKGGNGKNLVGTFGAGLIAASSLAELSSISGNSAGSWTLKIADTAARDVGSLKSWKLVFK